ncbi:MAG: hypothetical protein KA072_13670 [Thermoanaerobaculaceae bacterium]|nr:hypothetical protein [Thermoanaerobaculaceae bacterium]MDI9621913.1 DUF1788 domain-containing protein [Acidobacteriota bacterium]NLH11621.1 DUF1788 domain-containing protein [Holophagae bacterium]
MSRIERLLANFRRHVSLEWERHLAGPQKVWFAVYPPSEERRLRLHVEEFGIATREAQHGWKLVDLTDAFPQWMAQLDYRDAYFAEPELLKGTVSSFLSTITGQLRQALTDSDADDCTVVAVLGVGTLFGQARVSDLVGAVASSIRGRLLVFFPGSFESGIYRLLDARDGWNYMAVPITSDERELG